jgi:hypothetical protein
MNLQCRVCGKPRNEHYEYGPGPGTSLFCDEGEAASFDRLFEPMCESCTKSIQPVSAEHITADHDSADAVWKTISSAYYWDDGFTGAFHSLVQAIAMARREGV